MVLDELNMTDICLLSNSTCFQIQPFGAYVVLCTLAVVVVIFTVCGNLLVIISVYHFKQLHSPTNVLILSLAISDCLVGLFVMPVHSMTLIDSCLLFGSNFCSFYLIIDWHLTFVSVYNIFLIAIDRYFALSNPFLYSNRVSLSQTFIVVIHLWILSLLYNGALHYFNGNFSSKCPSNCFASVDAVWSTVDLTVVFILPCASIIILYLKVFFIARRHALLIRASLQDRKRQDIHNSTDSMRLERKAAKVVGILVSVFMMCLIPYYVCIMLYDMLGQMHGRVITTVISLFLLNSTINPIIYALFYPWFQKSMKLILTLKIFRADSSLMNVFSGDT